MAKEILVTVGLGLGTVAFALVMLILIIMLMHAVISAFTKNEKSASEKPVQVVNNDADDIDHGTLVAVASAAIAETLGKDVSAIRIKSIKKL